MADTWSALAGAYAEAWNAHDLAAIMALHTPDTQYQIHNSSERIVGTEAVARAFADDLRRMPDIHFELLILRGGPDHFVFRSRITGTDRGGRSVDVEAIDFMTTCDGLVVSKDTYLASPPAKAAQ